MGNTTQKEYLRNYLTERKGEWIPIRQLVNLGIYRYGAIFFKLRKEGMQIQMKMKICPDAVFRNQQHIEYRLVDDELLKQEKKELAKKIPEIVKKVKENICTKKSYTTEREAKCAINCIKKHARNKIPNRIYKCPECGLRHLTSQPDFKSYHKSKGEK